MTYKTDPSSFLADWWQFAVFVVGAFAAYIAGKERQRFKVDHIGQEVERQGQRINA